jgi:hypothetical protein
MLKLLLMVGLVYVIYRFWDAPKTVIRNMGPKKSKEIKDEPGEYVEYEEVE